MESYASIYSGGRRQILRIISGGLLLSPFMGFRGLISDRPWVISKSMQEELPGTLALHGLSTLSVALIEEDRIWQKTFDAQDNTLNTEHPAYEAGSLSKPIAAVAALQLQEKGDLDFDTPLMEYLPLADLKKVAGSEFITTRHVLSHSSGLQNWRFRALDKLSLRFAPGTSFSYSGEGYVWLQRIIEEITGMGYAQYVQEHLFKPLGMVSSSFAYQAALYDRLVSGYQRDGTPGDEYGKRIGSAMAAVAAREGTDLSHWNLNKVAEVYPDIEPDLPPLPVFLGPNAAGSLVTTAYDYALFVRAILNDHHQILGLAQSLEALSKVTSHVMPTIDWGLGWGLEQSGKKQLLFHTAETRFYKGATVLDIADKRGIVVLTNGANGDRVYDPLLRQVTGYQLKGLERF